MKKFYKVGKVRAKKKSRTIEYYLRNPSLLKKIKYDARVRACVRAYLSREDATPTGQQFHPPDFFTNEIVLIGFCYWPLGVRGRGRGRINPTTVTPDLVGRRTKVILDGKSGLGLGRPVGLLWLIASHGPRMDGGLVPVRHSWRPGRDFFSFAFWANFKSVFENLVLYGGRIRKSNLV